MDGEWPFLLSGFFLEPWMPAYASPRFQNILPNGWRDRVRSGYLRIDRQTKTDVFALGQNSPMTTVYDQTRFCVNENPPRQLNVSADFVTGARRVAVLPFFCYDRKQTHLKKGAMCIEVGGSQHSGGGGGDGSRRVLFL